MVSRRGFLKLLGAGAAAAVAAPVLAAAPSLVLPAPAAPLFVPSRNLDFGVPKRILTATELPTAPVVLAAAPVEAAARMAGTVPMLMVQDNYVREWGGLIRAGAQVLVDPVTAERWETNGVAVSAVWKAAFLTAEEIGGTLPPPTISGPLTWKNAFQSAGGVGVTLRYSDADPLPPEHWRDCT